MKKIKAIALLVVFVLGLGASACHPKHSCPAYGKAHSTSKHRRV